MHYIFELCPKCMNELIERDIEDFQEFIPGICPNCGNRMEAALWGNTKTENTVYKIILNKVQNIDKSREKCQKIIMKIGGLDADAAREKMNTQGSIIFEGDLLHTYLNLNMIDQMGTAIDYSVMPSFPYDRALSIVCLECGEEAEYKVDYKGKKPVKSGYFCNNCRQWIMYDVYSEQDMDETIYYIEATIEDVDGEVRQEIIHHVEELWDKKIENNKIWAQDHAKKIQNVLNIMENYNIPYKVNPPFPYKIPEMKPVHKNEWTEEEIRKLIEDNPGLKITADELNALN